ncbi:MULTISPECIES: hypothetical protein [Halomonadaceae]|nr:MULTISPECIES: hypothetical protein [Halomonas]
MTPKPHTNLAVAYRAPSAVAAHGVGFGGQYWYWFSIGVPAAGS